MTDSLLELRKRISSAEDLGGVVRTMKALAASRISQFEGAVDALRQYSFNVEQGLALALKPLRHGHPLTQKNNTYLIAYGSDQGLVGQFNDRLADYVNATLVPDYQGLKIIVVGERLSDQLAARNLDIIRSYPVPTRVESISDLNNQILIEEHSLAENTAQLHIILCHNKISGTNNYTPQSKTVMPLNLAWEQHLHDYIWPTNQLPELCGQPHQTLRALLGEYLFISLFRACAESLASENLCRLTAMQRAEKNISEQLEGLHKTYHLRRQENIDTELFDVLAGFNQFRS